jgi:hypothetical protein
VLRPTPTATWSAPSLTPSGPPRQTASASESLTRGTAGWDGGVFNRFDLACGYGLKAQLLGDARIAADRRRERSRALDLAIDHLRRLVATGYRPRLWFENEPQLEPLRSRPDFQTLLMDLAFPAEPFAH